MVGKAKKSNEPCESDSANSARTSTFEKAQTVELTGEDHRLARAALSHTSRPDLSELLRGITPGNVHGEADFGAGCDRDLLP